MLDKSDMLFSLWMFNDYCIKINATPLIIFMRVNRILNHLFEIVKIEFRKTARIRMESVLMSAFVHAFIQRLP